MNDRDRSLTIAELLERALQPALWESGIPFGNQDLAEQARALCQALRDYARS